MTSLSPSIQPVLELFNGPLSSVRFADIDAAGLASLAGEVNTAASEVEELEAKLAELRHGLAQRQEALLVLAQRALAYARVYAENDEALLAELNRIALPRAAKTRKPGAAKATGARAGGRAEPSGSAAPGVEVAESGAASEVEAASGETLAGEPLRTEPLRTEPLRTEPLRSARKGRAAARANP